ncbi:MAG: YdiU family protein [Betaproteobacteria bacterium]|nr:YdiU family protein [Betaproteobacteria bacterium]
MREQHTDATTGDVRLEEMVFDNSYARLPAAFHTRLPPTALPDPYPVAFNPRAAALLGLDARAAARPEFVEYFSGNRPLPGAEPLAAVYAGHQFGTFMRQLGDGRAILLGEAVHAGRRWDLQLKGAGRTPYSRSGDGRAVLRSCIREYLCSEAMHGLGIPTTRALSIVGSDQPVYRESVETAAVLLRMSPSHVRFGSFEFFHHRRQYDEVRTLADFVMQAHYPDLVQSDQPYLALLREVIRRTARLVAQWQGVGFCHGVMNTDNMSILGLTIDYGPYGFLEAFDPGYICNHSDDGGRYAYDMQPRIAHWNLFCLAQALLPLMEQDQAEAALAEFETDFDSAYAPLLREKFGLSDEMEGDAQLTGSLFDMMRSSNADYTILFRRLCDFSTTAGARNEPLRDMFIVRDAFDRWAGDYHARLARESGSDTERAARMRRVNPKYVLRNHLAEAAIRKAADQRDYTEIETLRSLLEHPYDEQPAMERYAAHPPDWASSIQVSCSS